MRANPFYHGLFMASSLFTGGFARTCRPQNPSSSLSSNEPTSTFVDPTTTLSTQSAVVTDSTEIRTSTSETTSSTMAPSSDTTFIDDVSTSTTNAPSSGTTDIDTASTSVATITDSSTTAEVTSVEPTSVPNTSTMNDAPTSATEATSTTGFTTATEVSSTTQPSPTAFYLKSSSTNPALSGLPIQVNDNSVVSNVYLIVPSAFASAYHPGQIHLEQDTNRLMSGDKYLVVTPGPQYLMLSTQAQITNELYVTCTAFIGGAPIQCQSGSSTEFATTNTGGMMFMLNPGANPSSPRIDIYTSSSQ